VVDGWVEDVLVAKGYRPVVRDQPFLFPPDMREWLPPDHPVWAVIAIVGRLDTTAFHARRRVGGVGRAGYDPDMLLALLIWAWSQGMRSSRRIERACADVVSYRVICAGDGPDHATISRFRQENHAACEQLFTRVLVLAAQLGLGRLETVALDGVKIASNASLSANRTATGLAKAAEAEAARIAAKALAEHAATDDAEDALYGDANPELVPAELADPVTRTARIDEAIARLNAQAGTDPDDRDAGPPEDSGESTESVEPERVPRDRSARIAQARARIDAEITAEHAEHDAAARQYLQRIDAGEKVAGRPPVGALVEMAERALAKAIAASEAKHGRRSAVDAGPAAQRRSAGRRPVPVAQNARVRQAQARLDKARAAEIARAQAAAKTAGRIANITDPQSRMQPVRGGGWVQGYNCQAVTAADGLILTTGVGISPVDNQYYRDMIEKAVTAAELITRHRPADRSELATETIGIVLADAGYCTKENLTAPGPDRLIATGKARDLHVAASQNPAQGTAPDDTDPIAAMNHRLRTPQGMATYAQRSHIAETPFGHAKHNLNFRQFTSRGLARACNEWAFHGLVHNIDKIIAHLAGAPLPA
jgi:transposase